MSALNVYACARSCVCETKKGDTDYELAKHKRFNCLV